MSEGKPGYVGIQIIITDLEAEHFDSRQMRALLLGKCECAYKHIAHAIGLDDGTYDLFREIK